MSKIFLSHSSDNNAEALALAQWLKENGWDDYFLDIEPTRGISPGERWQHSLKQAAQYCELIILLISPAWRDSPWCIAECLVAKLHGKRIFGVLIEPVALESLPSVITAEWQLCDLLQGEKQRSFQVKHDPTVPTTTVSFSEVGLTKLKIGLQRVGLDSRYFPWPPPDPDERIRSPYRGLKALEAMDAPIFFGRDSAITRGLVNLRSMREQMIERWLIILGASGSGKSSFLRAGLWPRLLQDDMHFLPLPIIRPQHAIMNGDTGVLASIAATFERLGKKKNRAAIRAELQTADGLMQVLTELQQLAQTRQGLTQSTFSNTSPTVVISIDQGEELFNVEGRAEAEQFLTLLTTCLALPESSSHPDTTTVASCSLPLVIVTIRSDTFEQFQTEPLLDGSHHRLFDLPPITPHYYPLVIEGPAARQSEAGHQFHIEPALTEQLLKDSTGADALPLLAFTLERLYLEYGTDDDLRLDEYNTMGGIRGAIDTAVNAALSFPERNPEIPADQAEKEQLLRNAFIPWLVSIDPDTHERKRNIANWDDLPPETHPVVERLVNARLLVSDRRKLNKGIEAVTVVEVAHEALLRQWTLLTRWLDEEEIDLRILQAVQRAASDWDKQQRSDDWLIHAGERLSTAERVRARKGFSQKMGEIGISYLTACRAKQDRAQPGTPAYELAHLTQAWQDRIGPARLWGLASIWQLWKFKGLATPGSPESIYLRWSRRRAAINAVLGSLILGLFSVQLIDGLRWTQQNSLPTEYVLHRLQWQAGFWPEPGLVKIPPGKFTMGCKQGRDDIDGPCSENELPTQEVSIAEPFLIGKYEVTYAQYDYYVWQQRKEGHGDIAYPDNATGGRGDHPVVNVDWWQATRYAEWFGKQQGLTCGLPTEVEWEYAARAGSETAYPWGNEIGENRANCNNCGSRWDGKQSAPVGQFAANAFGLFDTAGNVWEWTCSNFRSPFDGSEQVCSLDEEVVRVLRGGSWGYSPDDLRVSFRSDDRPVYRNFSIGFRVLCLSPIRE